MLDMEAASVNTTTMKANVTFAFMNSPIRNLIEVGNDELTTRRILP